MNRNVIHSASCILSLLALGCIEPYTIEGVRADLKYLVVDGFINASEKTCSVRLSRSVSLNDEHIPPGEAGAIVSVRSEDGGEFFLTEQEGDDAGVYVAGEIAVIPDQNYKLHIVLGNGRQYESTFIRIERAAQIASLIWIAGDDEIDIHVSTVPNSSSTQFYRWRLEESWQYNAPRSSNMIIRDGRPNAREPHESVFTCYRTDPSYNILIGSSQNLTSNVIRNYIVQSVSTSSIRLSMLYRIMVRQYALSEEAYTFWLNLYKTTENTGGLFDPMPGQVTGNIKCVSDPSEPVIGYFSGSTVEEKAIWISRYDLPRGYVTYRAPLCPPDTLGLDQIGGLREGTPLVDAVFSPFGSLIGYTFASPSCVDCRVYGGGTTNKPHFWP